MLEEAAAAQRSWQDMKGALAFISKVRVRARVRVRVKVRVRMRVRVRVRVRVSAMRRRDLDATYLLTYLRAY